MRLVLLSAPCCHGPNAPRIGDRAPRQTRERGSVIRWILDLVTYIAAGGAKQALGGNEISGAKQLLRKLAAALAVEPGSCRAELCLAPPQRFGGGRPPQLEPLRRF